jgi:hypothetical protein
MLARMLTKGLCTAALGLLLASPPMVQAGPIQSQIYFSSIGSVDSFNVSGTPVVSFQGASGTITSGSPFSLGNFVISSPPAGWTTTYTNIPFQVLFKTEAVNGTVPTPNETPVILTGWLNGTVSAGAAGSSPQSNLTVMFAQLAFIPESSYVLPYPVTVMPFMTGNLTNYLYITNPINNGGSVQANLITTQNVPEPSSIAIFASIAGLGLWQRRRNASSNRAGLGRA